MIYQALAVVQAEMQGAPDTAAILEALHATKATAKERQLEMERKIRQVGSVHFSPIHHI